MKASQHRPTQASVDLQAIAANFRQVMAHLPSKVAGYAVVKADAYGHGALAVARALASQVQGFCVSNIDEALELREGGIQLPILVLGVVSFGSLDLAIEERIAVTVTSLAWCQEAVAAGLVLTSLKVHLKVDSGMGRLGFRELASLEAAMDLLKEAGAEVEGIFTHFATADEQDTQQFAQQLATFKRLLSQLKVCPKLVHASNSATSIWHREGIFTMVRLGNVLYGLNPSGHQLSLPYPVTPALSLTSELVHVKELPPGAPIGYGATYTCPETEWIGTVPIGYADGFVRKMQGFSVLVDGQFCEVVGRVSMDQITIRLPKAYPLGTKVTLIGQDGAEEICVQDWADYLGTIHYEVVCLLSDRIPRVYSDLKN